VKAEFRRHWSRRIQVCWLFGLALMLGGCGASPETRTQLARLRSKDAGARLKAIAEAETHADAEVRTELLRMFQNERDIPLVRGYAGIVLARWHDPRILPEVVKRLPMAIEAIGKPAPKPSLDAFLLSKALTAYGSNALLALTPLLQDPRKEIVAWTIMHHGAYQHDERAYAVLSRYLNDRDPILRGAAAFGVSLFAHPRAEELALAHLADPDAEVRYNLAWALLNFGSNKSVRGLDAQLVREKDPRVREELVKAQSAVRSRSVVVLPAASGKPQPPPRAGSAR
jgi:HEAT repeats